MGAVTGQGLAGLIRENFGLRTTFLAMAALFFINAGITATEFAGIGAASEIFGVSRYIAVPVSMIVVFLFVLRLPNKIVERVFVVLSLIYVSYIGPRSPRIRTGAKSRAARSFRRSSAIRPSWSPSSG